MFSNRLPSLPLLLVACFLTWGCTCSREEKPAPRVEQKQEPTKPTVPPRVDEALLADLRDATDACKEGAQHFTCSGGKKNSLTLEFNRGKRAKTSALPTFTYALSPKDPKLSALAASVLYASFRLGLGTSDREAQPSDIRKEDAQALLSAALALPGQPATQAIPAAVHAMLLSGQHDELKAALAKGAPIQVQTMALRYLMVYGRLNVFSEVQAKSEEPGTAVVLAAVESPRNMKRWTQEERTEICPWLLKFVEDSRAPVAGNAMAGLSNCDTDAIDTLIGKLEGTLRAKTFSFIHATTLRTLCSSSGTSRDSQASDAQCDRVRKLQERAATEKDLKPRVRAMTLSNVAYIWPDEKSLRLAQKLEKDQAPEVAKAAEQIIKRLQRRLAQE